MHIIITHAYVWHKQVELRENWHSSLLVKIAKLAAIAMATTIIIV